MRNVEAHLLEDKMDEAVTHYMNSHHQNEPVHIDSNGIPMTVQDDGAGRVTVMHQQTYTTQMMRQVSVTEQVGDGPWGEELLEGPIAAIVAHLQNSRHHPVSHHKASQVRSDVDTSVILDNNMRFSGQGLDQQSESIVVQLPPMQTLPPLQDMKRCDTDWFSEKNKKDEAILQDSDSQVLEMARSSPAHKHQNRKSLPHKKRISRKLKRNTGNSTPQQELVVINCSEAAPAEHEQILPDNYVPHATHVPQEMRPVLICQECGAYYGEDQLKFYQHLRGHYEPPHTIIIENPVPDLPMDKISTNCMVDNVATLPDSIVELSLENTVPKTLYQPIDKHILYTASDKSLSYNSNNKVQYSIANIDAPAMENDKSFKKHRHVEAQARESHAHNTKLEDMGEFSEPEDLMAGIQVCVEPYEPTLLPHLTVDSGHVHQDHTRSWYSRNTHGNTAPCDAYCGVCAREPDTPYKLLKEEVLQRILETEVSDNANFADNMISDHNQDDNNHEHDDHSEHSHDHDDHGQINDGHNDHGQIDHDNISHSQSHNGHDNIAHSQSHNDHSHSEQGQIDHNERSHINHIQNQNEHGQIDHSQSHDDHGHIEHSQNQNNHVDTQHNYDHRHHHQNHGQSIICEDHRQSANVINSSQNHTETEHTEALRHNDHSQNSQEQSHNEDSQNNHWQIVHKVDSYHSEHSQDNDDIIEEQQFVIKKENNTKSNEKGKMYSCSKCDRVFAHRNSLIYHMLMHKGKQFKCNECNKEFYTASALKIHIRRHNDVRPYKCDLCNRDFRQWTDLRYHTNSIHSEKKNFKCSYCGKEFARKYSLTLHVKIHTGEKNFQCEICHKAFRCSSYKITHMRTHTDDRPYVCGVCEKGFRSSFDLRRHSNIHGKRKPEDKMKTKDKDKIKPEPRVESPERKDKKVIKMEPFEPTPKKTKQVALASTARQPVVVKKPKKMKGAPNVTVRNKDGKFTVKGDDNEKETYVKPEHPKKHIFLDSERVPLIFKEESTQPRHLAVLKPLGAVRTENVVENDKNIVYRAENTDGKMQVFTQVEKGLAPNSQGLGHLEREGRDDVQEGENGFIERLTALYSLSSGGM